ncbi:hypothetical protein EDD15DRAFT_2374906 [Pisolithus albus]|nr:hypothetical protein EDD15DRAFT_2374906 [Pisolithus albus]
MKKHERSRSLFCATSSELTDSMFGLRSIRRPNGKSPLTTVPPISPKRPLQNRHPEASAESIVPRRKVSLVNPDHSDSKLSGNNTSGIEAAEDSSASTSQPKGTLVPVQGGPASEEGEPEGAEAINSQEEATIRLAAASARREVVRAERHLAMCLVQEHDILCELYCLQAELSKKEVAVADHEIGHLRDAIRTKGFQLVNDQSVTNAADTDSTFLQKIRAHHNLFVHLAMNDKPGSEQALSGQMVLPSPKGIVAARTDRVVWERDRGSHLHSGINAPRKRAEENSGRGPVKATSEAVYPVVQQKPQFGFEARDSGRDVVDTPDTIKRSCAKMECLEKFPT